MAGPRFSSTSMPLIAAEGRPLASMMVPIALGTPRVEWMGLKIWTMKVSECSLIWSATVWTSAWATVVPGGMTRARVAGL